MWHFYEIFIQTNYTNLKKKKFKIINYRIKLKNVKLNAILKKSYFYKNITNPSLKVLLNKNIIIIINKFILQILNI